MHGYVVYLQYASNNIILAIIIGGIFYGKKIKKITNGFYDDFLYKYIVFL